MFGISGEIQSLITVMEIEKQYQKRCLLAEGLGFEKPAREEYLSVKSEPKKETCTNNSIIWGIIGYLIGSA